MRRIVSASGDRCYACGESFPHAETGVPRAENRFCMRRLVFHVRRPACGEMSPHAETRAMFRMLRKCQLAAMIGTYTSFSSIYTTYYGTPRKLLLPTDPWVITAGLYMLSSYESSTSLKGPKTRKRSLAWRPNTCHMALSVLQLECHSVIIMDAQRAIENALAFRAVQVHTLVHELRKLLPQLLAN